MPFLPKKLGAKAGPTKTIGQRKSARERGYTWEWEKASKAFLAANPLCVHCLAKRRAAPATLVDHIIPHRGDTEGPHSLFWDKTNWQGLCVYHHGVKTAAGQ